MIETDDGATIMLEWHGYGHAYPVGRRQIVGAVVHLSGDERYSRLNDVVCVSVGEVRASSDPDQETELVADIAELIWEPITDSRLRNRFLGAGRWPSPESCRSAVIPDYPGSAETATTIRLAGRFRLMRRPRPRHILLQPRRIGQDLPHLLRTAAGGGDLGSPLQCLLA